MDNIGSIFQNEKYRTYIIFELITFHTPELQVQFFLELQPSNVQ